MRKAQHTQGPWSKHPMSSNEPFVVAPEDGEKPWVSYHVDVGVGKMRIASVLMCTGSGGYPSVDNKAECDANASLIFAAPDLLESTEFSFDALDAVYNIILKYGLATDGQFDDAIELIEMAQSNNLAAIAKAKGESS